MTSNEIRFTTEPPKSKEIDAEEGITQHGVQLYVLEVVGWKFRCFITSLIVKGLNLDTWTFTNPAGGMIRVDGFYKPNHDCILCGAQLTQVQPGKRKKLIRERYFEPFKADKNTVGEINLTVHYK